MSDVNSKHTKQITEAAVKLFKANGYDKVSVNDICKSAGVARSSFYLVFSGKKAVVKQILIEALAAEHFELTSSIISAKNDFERMWVICCQYLTLAEIYGPELSGSFFRLELTRELDVIDEIHTIDTWVTKLARHAQNVGIIRNMEPAEVIAPIVIDAVYYVTFHWCKNRGSFSLRQRARQTAEAILNVAPEYRWTEEQCRNEGRE